MGERSLTPIEQAIERAGLASRGALRLDASDRIGELAPFSTLVLVGMVGSAQWPAFSKSPEAADGAPHPLDRWSRRVIGALARELGALALHSFEGPPYWPFQAWARRAEPVFPSPIGMLVHREFGLWHSYRGALAFHEPIAIPPVEPTTSPCESCAEKPCLSACPVGAFTPHGYDVENCAAHVRGGGDCFDGGCRARRACAVGRDHAYNEDQTRFYMPAFLAARAVSQ